MPLRLCIYCKKSHQTDKIYSKNNFCFRNSGKKIRQTKAKSEISFANLKYYSRELVLSRITFLEFCHDDSYLDHGLYPCFCRDHDHVIWILIGDPEILNKINVDIGIHVAISRNH